MVPGRFDLVRAANILNRGYFKEADLRRMIRALLKRMAPQSLLLALRTAADGANHGTLSRRSGPRLGIIGHLNEGSEVQPLVTAAADSMALQGQPWCGEPGQEPS